MKKKGQAIVSYVIIVIIAFFMASIIWGQVKTATNTGSASQGSVTLTADTPYTLTYDDLIQGAVSIGNSSNNTLVEGTHYNVSYQYGRVTLNSVTGTTTGTYDVNYSYYPDNYAKNSTARLLTTLLGIFMAILVLVIIIGKITGGI